MQTCRPGPQVYEFRRVQMSKYRICTLVAQKKCGEKIGSSVDFCIYTCAINSNLRVKKKTQVMFLGQ